MPNINADARFARVPQIEKPRSIFNRPCTHKTSFDVGQVIPIYCDVIYPGTTVKITTSKVVRLQTLLTPILDNIFLDTYWFKIPLRLIWTHAKEFFGENSQSAWIPPVEYEVPSISSPVDSVTGDPVSFETGTLADYFGLPLVPWDNDAEARPMALPFRAYALVMNEFFRSENLTDPLNIPVGDSNQIGSNGSDYINDVANGGKPFVAAKFFDRFSGALPSPQKGPAVQFGTHAVFPGYTLTNGPVAVGSSNIGHDFSDFPLVTEKGANHYALYNTTVGSNNTMILNAGTDWAPDADTGVITGNTSHDYMYPINLWADLPDLEIPEISLGGVSFSVNELRIAFQLQRYYEALSRSGSRYRELLRNLWGSSPADASLQVPEYLGGNRVPIQIHEIVNTAQSASDYLGDLGAMSHTADISFDFETSFDEHCILLGLCVARYAHSFAQGMEPFWNRLRREEWYIPQFANIGELPVYQNEICATEDNMKEKVVFGYQEAWSDLRYKQDYITGELRPGITNTLASWHLSDYYESPPTLSDEWIREDKNIVDRVLAVGSNVSNQIFCDFYFDAVYTEVLPMYSVPGLIDHY